jgi:hypothetical protein
MKEKQTFPVELEPAKLAFLEAMAAKHGLPDAGKAIRCLIDHARTHPELEGAIFDDVHCVDC